MHYLYSAYSIFIRPYTHAEMHLHPYLVIYFLGEEGIYLEVEAPDDRNSKLKGNPHLRILKKKQTNII